MAISAAGRTGWDEATVGPAEDLLHPVRANATAKKVSANVADQVGRCGLVERSEASFMFHILLQWIVKPKRRGMLKVVRAGRVDGGSPKGASGERGVGRNAIIAGDRAKRR